MYRATYSLDTQVVHATQTVKLDYGRNTGDIFTDNQWVQYNVRTLCEKPSNCSSIKLSLLSMNLALAVAGISALIRFSHKERGNRRYEYACT